MEFNVNNSFFTGKFLIHLAAVDSTNNFAKEHMAKSSPIDGTVILADEQFAGRGQAGSAWASDANTNLTFSLIYHTSFLRATEQFYLNMAVSYGLMAAVDGILNSDENEIRDIPVSLKVKWPNDILADGKKIAGILIENTISGMQLKYSVIGIGLNVNQTEFPEGITATGIKKKGSPDLDRNKILNAVLSSIEKYFLLLRERKFETLKNYYLENLYRYKTEALFIKEGKAFLGTITDISPSGDLILATKEGIEKFRTKEISFT